MPGAAGSVAFQKAATEAAHLLPVPPKGKHQGTATGPQLALNLVVCGLGTGIFTLPWSTAGASVFLAISIIAGVLVVNAWTISFIVEAAERHQKFDIGSLLACIPGSLGPWARIGCNIALCLSTYLCLVSYIIVIVDSLGQSLPAWALSHRSTLVVLAAMLVLPLCFLDQQRLSSTSLVAVLANVYIFMVVVALFLHKELEGIRPPVCYFGASTGSIAMISAMMQTVVIQMCVLPMYAEMRDRSVARFNRVVAVSFSALFLLCVGFSVLGYLTFGQGTSSNVLLDLPTTRWGGIARLGAATGVIGVYPIIMSPIVAALRGSPAALALLRRWQGFQGGPGSESAAAAAATVAVVFASMVAALYFRDLGQLNVVNGALSMGTFVALVPCVVGLNLLGEKSQQLSWRASMYTLAAIGAICSGLGLVLTDNYAKELPASCSWFVVTPAQ